MINSSVKSLQTCTKIVFFYFLLTACGFNKYDVDVSEIEIDNKIERFEQDLFVKNYDSPLERTDYLVTKYGSFYHFFCGQAIRIERVGHPNHELSLSPFMEDSSIKELYSDVESVFPDISAIEEKLIEDFKRYNYHFPESKTPQIITFISGFNYSIIRTDSAMGIGLDRYLDTLKNYYNRLGYPAYLVRKMNKKFIFVLHFLSYVKSISFRFFFKTL